MFVERECRWRISRTDKHDGTSALIVSKEIINQPFSVSFALGGGTNGYVFYFVNTLSFTRHYRDSLQTVIIEGWKIQCKLPPKTKRFCPLVLK